MNGVPCKSQGREVNQGDALRQNSQVVPPQTQLVQLAPTGQTLEELVGNVSHVTVTHVHVHDVIGDVARTRVDARDVVVAEVNGVGAVLYAVRETREPVVTAVEHVHVPGGVVVAAAVVAARHGRH